MGNGRDGVPTMAAVAAMAWAAIAAAEAGTWRQWHCWCWLMDVYSPNYRNKMGFDIGFDPSHIVT